jgi:polyvinyl alcohol dehydrogenase (cytochrome)
MRRTATASGILLVALGLMDGGFSRESPQAAPYVASVPAAALTPAWTTYHLDNARTGNDTTEGNVVGVTPAWTAMTAGGSSTLDGNVYASPLVYGTSVYVATENNTVYAFSTTSGAEQWRVHFGAPRTASLLPCGNISPVVGITGTPVIDTAAAGGHGVIFMAAMTNEPHYRLYGVDLVTHLVVFNTIIDAGHIAVEGQRGALALANGNIYIPFGGRAGDCYDTDGTPYYGIVVAVPESGATHFAFIAPNTQAAGIWAPGGEAVDASGNVYVALGNGIGPGTESVYKLSPLLKVVNQWRPSNHQALDDADQDVGSIIPALIGGGDVFQNGKNGHGYVLSSTLVQQTPDPGIVSCGGLTSDASFGASAYAAPYLYVPCANGLRAYSQSGHTLAPVWNQLSTFAGPPILAGGDVWTQSAGNLYGFNAVTGQQIANVSVGSFSRFESPAAGGGRIFTATTAGLKAFNLVHGCSAATLSAAPPSPQVAGTGVTLTATATGPVCTSPVFEFWLQYPNGMWVMKQAFSSSATWNWDTTGYPAGTYKVHVWGNQAGNPTKTYEALAEVIYSLTPAPACATASLNPPAPSQPAGSLVSFTASSTGCTSPQYEFWVQLLDGKWYMKRVFSSVATWDWSTSGLRPGTYTVHVWANQQGHQTKTYEGLGSSTVTLTGCTSATTIPGSGSSAVGTSVTFTTSAMGCPNPVYEYWLQWIDGTWHQMTGFGGPTWTWNITSFYARGTYHIHAWANQQGAYTGAFETFGSSTYTVQ